MSSFPPPPLTPLARLQVKDGLLLNAERWQLAHAYHRQRQNLHYQALNQPGIVCGLGVGIVNAPPQVGLQYRDDRWLRIQPGIAIDCKGNPIVVPQAFDYRIVAEAITEPLLVYLVISYVDPDQLDGADQQAIVQETFRVEEKIAPPDELEVELCRILLQPGPVKLQAPPDVFFPIAHQIDLRYRQLAQSRSKGEVCCAQFITGDSADLRTTANIRDLLVALDGLYPALQGASTVAQTDLGPDDAAVLMTCDLLHLPYLAFTQLREDQLQLLAPFLESGGVVLLEAPGTITNLEELTRVRYEVQRAIAMAERQPNVAVIRRDLAAELQELNLCIDQAIEDLAQPIYQLSQQTGLTLTGIGHLGPQHPLRSRPFRFVQFPVLNLDMIEVLNWGGIVLVIGDLSGGWGHDEVKSLSREEIRGAQELGINLLHFAWQRRQLHQWLIPQSLTPSRPLSTPVPPPASVLSEIFQQLDS